MSVLWQDLRLAARMLARHPALSIAAAVALCLGIGPTTAIFSIVHATLLAPLPYPEPDRLVMVWSYVNGGRSEVSAGDYLEWKERARSFDEMEVFVYGQANLSTEDVPERIDVRKVTANGYRIHRVPVWLGRDFLPEDCEPGKDHVTILSHDLWQRRYGADPQIVGREIRLDAEPYTVIGVLPPGIFDRMGADVWLPLAFAPDQRTHDFRSLLIMARLKAGVTIAQAQQEMAIVTADMARKYPSSNTGWSASVEPLQNNFLRPNTEASLWLLLAAVGLVTLIACADVANLLLARATAREPEMAIRASLGASRAQLLRQMMTESLLLAGVGGALGVLSAVWILQGVLALLPQYTLSGEADPRLNLPVLLFALALTVMAGIVFGCAPAWHATRVDLNTTLRQGGRTAVPGSRRGLRTLVIAELALAVSLLAGAGLTMQSFWNRARVDLGVETDGVLTFAVLAQERRLPDAQHMDVFYRQLLDRVQAIPGVAHAAVMSTPPLFSAAATEFTIAGRPAVDAATRPSAQLRVVSPGYFETFGMRVVKGRAFTPQDSAGRVRVAMVNEAFVRRYLGGVDGSGGLDPLRERLLVAEKIPGKPMLGAPVEWQIVGVYHDASNGRLLGERVEPEIDVPFAQSPMPQVMGAVRVTDGDPARTRQAIAEAVQALAPGLPLSSVRTLDRIVRDRLAPERLNVALLGGLAFVALLLAAVGIYGVMAFLVGRRTSEIGLRMALGAGAPQILTRVLGDGLRLALTGLALGLIGAIAIGFAMRSMLFGTGAINAGVLAAVCLILLATALAACYLPARRASAVDPMSALRQL